MVVVSMEIHPIDSPAYACNLQRSSGAAGVSCTQTRGHTSQRTGFTRTILVITAVIIQEI